MTWQPGRILSELSAEKEDSTGSFPRRQHALHLMKILASHVAVHESTRPDELRRCKMTREEVVRKELHRQERQCSTTSVQEEEDEASFRLKAWNADKKGFAAQR